MIVVDTNTIAYLFLPAPETEAIEQLLQAEPHWCAPLLWRSEFRNILATYARKELIDFDTAREIQTEAEALIGDNEFDVDSAAVLDLAIRSGCSAYDCEFVALAQALRTGLVTADRKLLKAFPADAETAKSRLQALPRSSS